MHCKEDHGCEHIELQVDKVGGGANETVDSLEVHHLEVKVGL